MTDFYKEKFLDIPPVIYNLKYVLCFREDVFHKIYFKSSIVPVGIAIGDIISCNGDYRIVEFCESQYKDYSCFKGIKINKEENPEDYKIRKVPEE